jgi:hypothetical protein
MYERSAGATKLTDLPPEVIVIVFRHLSSMQNGVMNNRAAERSKPAMALALTCTKLLATWRSTVDVLRWQGDMRTSFGQMSRMCWLFGPGLHELDICASMCKNIEGSDTLFRYVATHCLLLERLRVSAIFVIDCKCNESICFMLQKRGHLLTELDMYQARSK